VLLHGIDQAGTAVLLAAAQQDLPANVKGVMADGVSPTLTEQIKTVFHWMKRPLDHLALPIASLFNRLFCGFFYGQCSPKAALQSARVPVLLLNGEKDAFVKPEQAGALQAAAPAGTVCYVAAGGRHLDGFEVDPSGYAAAMASFASAVFGEEVVKAWPEPGKAD
jgi:fermentation-respiration switch protein FrsA (DUF1100 family)